MPSCRRYGVNYWRGSDGRGSSLNFGPEIDYKVRGRFSSAISFSWTRNVSDNQWYGNYTDSLNATHYTFAHLNQTTRSATVRLNYTFTPNVSVQAYTQPFVSKGTYTNLRQLSATPRAADYDARYAVYDNPSVTSDPGRLQLQGVSVEHRLSVGVQARVDAVRGVERRTTGQRVGAR